MKILEKTKRKAFNAVGLIVNRLAQNEAKNTEGLDKTVTEGMPELLRKAAAEGTVLLRNDNVLPLAENRVVSVFGRVQYDYMYVGYGSGGDVIKPYTVNLIEGLENLGAKINTELADTYKAWCQKYPPDHGFWGHWPLYYDEMPIDTDVIESASKNSDCAVIVIGRAAGEDRENLLEEGSYFLTKDEKSLISRVSKAFKKTVIVLNIGSIIDMSWEEELLTGDTAILIPWQGGMESGNAVAHILYGKEEPSGRLPDTIARNYYDYPCSEDFGEKSFNNFTEDIYVGYRYFETFNKESVLYPFGFGLGYSEFRREFLNAEKLESSVKLTVKSTNISDYTGKDVIEIYAKAPRGKLGKPSRVLCDFKKTPQLNKDESAEFTFDIPLYTLASYDDSGITGHKSAYILEKGEYSFYVGGDVRSAEKVWSFVIENDIVIEQLQEVCASKESFERLIPKTDGNGKTIEAFAKIPVSTNNLRDIILKNLPDDCGYTGNMGYTLTDVKEGRCTLDAFVAQLSPDELEAISRGDYTMNSSLGNPGNAGALGGVLPSLRKKGVEPLITTDGPSGIRISACCSLLPVGTCISSMWNTDLAYEIYKKTGGEMKVKGSDILLAPGMNIHRSPLCGRNFEYYSEDPVLTGKTAAAVVKGLQSKKVGACPKHFACNSQETNRNRTDSRLSERALREIYLKGFEICVKEAKPLTVMTSYNKINGVWGHYNYDLCTRILKGEWGFQGFVMTDWWMQYTSSPEFPGISDNGYRVRAGVDVLMPGGKRTGPKKPDGTLLKTYGKKNGITLGEMQETAKRVIGVVLKIKYPD